MSGLSRVCQRCKRKRRLEEGTCAECAGRKLPAHLAKSGENQAERAELRRWRQGMRHTFGLGTRDHEHASHAKRLILVAGCRACSTIGHRLPPQNWSGR